MQDAPHHIPDEIKVTADEGMNDLVPEEAKSPLNVFKVIERLVDDCLLYTSRCV